MKPQRILYVNGGTMQRGGIESFMMSYYRNIDREKIQIDFIVHGFEEGAYDQEIERLGGRIFNVPIKSKNYFGNIKAIESILSSNDYKIIHSHLDAMSIVILKIAKKCGIPYRIAHSHNTDHLTKNKFKYLLNELARKRINNYATHFYACSKPAGTWLFGERQMKSGKVKIVNNAINLNDYTFNESIREVIRERLNISDKFVVGHVGRLDYQKNHDYLIDIFYELLKRKPNSVLVLVGDGILKKEIRDKINKLRINNQVMLLGPRNDVNLLLNSFDYFLLPSKFEGLGISLIEAQANGLKGITSINTPKEVNVTGNINFISTDDKDISEWVKTIISESEYERVPNREKLREAGYDIKLEAKKLQKVYLDLLEGKNENYRIL